MMIEAETDQFEMGFSAFKKIFKMLTNIKDYAKKQNFTEWTVTDFDNCLEGNPHVMLMEDEEAD